MNVLNKKCLLSYMDKTYISDTSIVCIYWKKNKTSNIDLYIYTEISIWSRIVLLFGTIDYKNHIICVGKCKCLYIMTNMDPFVSCGLIFNSS